MKIAIWTVTKRAAQNSEKIMKSFEATLYTLKKFNTDNLEFQNNIVKIENFTDSLDENFNNYDAHIFIMATGIVVRKIAPYLKGKDLDPAILVIDENINFVISLVSGHLGNANELSIQIAKKLLITPIITTSSDITGKIAVDTLAQKIKGELRSLEEAKDVTSLIVNGEKVQIKIPKNLNISENPQGVIIISNRENIKITQIYPKNLILGIGCKKFVEKNKIIMGIKLVMKKNSLSMKSIKKIATIDVKKNEKGLLEAAMELELPLEIVSTNEIKKFLENNEKIEIKGSDFVEKNVGVRAVSEPCAYLTSSKDGQFLEKKFIYDGITISIYEERCEDEKR